MAKKSKYGHLSREQIEARLEKLEKEGYGLKWEDKPEAVADLCDTQLPVLKEDKAKELISDPNLPTNYIIEGDNYHSLFTLNFTHKKKIDVIYIDPPYNTGKMDKNGRTDFKYNDNFVKLDDKYRHSSWLSFMNKRLRLAKNLLKDTGIIAISIDDNEICNLKLLCDKIFNENNHIGIIPTIMNLKGNQDQFGFAGTHEYTLFYAKNKNYAKIGEFKIDDIEDDWIEDEKGLYKKGRTLLADGKGKYREERQYMYFPLLIKNEKVSLITKEEHSKIYNKEANSFDDTFLKQLENKYVKKGYKVIFPIDSNKNLLRWTWGFDDKFQTHLDDIIITETKNGISLYKKQRPTLGDLPSKKPKSFFYKPEYSSGNGTNQLKKFVNADAFNNPKPLELIKDILLISGNENSTILDFFAGSGTTAQSVIELNKEDGGNRQFILCTNNENNICTEVTYPRVKKVIDGYADKEGIPANVKYFTQTFVNQVTSDKDKRELVNRSTELLCMAENTFDVISKRNTKNDFAIFGNTEKITSLIYDESQIEDCVNKLNQLNNGLPAIIYVFSYDHTYYTEDFENLKIKFVVKPIPEAILNVYRKIAKLRKK